MKKLLILILGLTFLNNAIGQNSSGGYARNSMSFFLMSHPSDSYDSWCIDYFNKLRPGDKYDINPLSSNIIEAEFNRDADFGKSLRSERIEEYLNNHNYGKEIISYWFNRQPDGSFNRKIIDARGEYNANESNIIVSNARQLGIATIKDSGNRLLKNSYVVVFDIRAISKDISKSTAILTWYGTVDTYLFSLDDSEYTTNQAKWLYTLDNPDEKYTESEIEAKKNYFKNAKFKLKHVITTTTNIVPPSSKVALTAFLDLANSNNKDYKAPVYSGTGEFEFKEFIERAYEQAMISLEKQRPDFKVRTLIRDTHPIVAKIGLKEGLKKKQMFDVYKMTLNEKTRDVKPHKVASVLATRVVNNSRNLVTDINSRKLYSKFTVVHQSGKIDKGMYLEQRPTKNISVYGDFIKTDGLAFYSLGMEMLNFISTKGISGSLLMDICMANNDIVNTIHHDAVIGSKLVRKGNSYSGYYWDYVDYIISDAYDENTSKDNTSVCFRIGYSIGFHIFTPNLKISPFAMAGLGYSTAKDLITTVDENGNDQIQFNEATYSYGARIGYNISSSCQLYFKYENIALSSMPSAKSAMGGGIKFSF